jgi:hypothetical protein
MGVDRFLQLLYKSAHMRQEVTELCRLGAFPPSHAVDLAVIKKQQYFLLSIERPVSNDEAQALMSLFGPDDYYGLAWTVLHLVESAPGWPLWDCLKDTSKEWIQTLRRRLENAGISSP